VKEVRIDHCRIVAQITGEDAGLPEPPDAIGRPVTAKILAKDLPCCGKTRLFARLPPAAQDPKRRAPEIFRQVVYARGDFVMDWVCGRIIGFAQGMNVEAHPACFQTQQFLCDEGFRQAGVAFEHDRNLRPRI